MKKARLLLTCLIVAAAIAALAAVTAELLYQTSGMSEFKLNRDLNGQQTVSTATQDYDLYREYNGSGFDLYLVDKKVTRTYTLDSEGKGGNSHWAVRKGLRLETPIWSKSEPVSLVDISEEWALVLSGKEGCCAEMTGYRAFDLKTGKLIVSYSDFSNQTSKPLPFILSVPNSSLVPRYIGLISGDSTRDRDFESPVVGMSTALLIKYANKDGAYQKLQVDMGQAVGWGVSVLDASIEADPLAPNSDKIEIKDGVATLWNIDSQTDPAKIEGILLKVTLSAGQGIKIIKIPVLKDRLSLERAEIPSGVQIRAL